MNIVKRATVGQLVKADVTGTGLWLTGKIVDFDKTHITYAPADGSEDVRIVRSDVYKATKEEYETEQVASEQKIEEIQSQPSDVDDLEVEQELKESKSGLARAADYNYEPCIAASGKKSKDNGDEVALELRGQSLEFAYQRAAEYLEVTESSLRAKYSHLNPGQQRMCLGNRIRGKK